MADDSSHSRTASTRKFHEDESATEQFQSPKRHKVLHHGDLPRQEHGQYTIAWACALHIEMAAARAMLDDIHPPLPAHSDDTNTYVLGNIKQHQIVIACLPSEQYATVNAANVVTNLKRTFPAIRVSLIVGIGGGVPGNPDIRLGDVVVGTSVVQYDLGKVIGDGQFHRTAIPRTPGLLLGTAISALRSAHELRPNRIGPILEEKLGVYPDYNRPKTLDRLFLPTYEHQHSLMPSCDNCDQTQLVLRDERAPGSLSIHYGTIASGNQVMRHGITRDRTARELRVICFEMEAAGVMDVFPSLTIRGICDYSDSHKTKEWQRYAAATAAAYARELIEEMPVTESQIRASGADRSSISKRRKEFLECLKFEHLNSRELSIQTAHGQTCQWLLDHADYQDWLDSEKLAQHQGFLWISGKAGTGKSTIMKFAFQIARRNDHKKGPLTASFFFNARGGELERSISGMYRSILLQLFEGCPDLQSILDLGFISGKDGCPRLDILKELLRDAVGGLGKRPFTCFIDALDECDQQEVVDMVQYFEDLAEKCTVNNIAFRICFSSRHYPHISLRRGIRLTLESQPGHAEDLAAYVSSHLHFKAPELHAQLLTKAGGIFMWVVLVIDILNKEYRRGGMALRKKLSEIPSGLSELFKDILKRDNDLENPEVFSLCILWILFAKRPLQPKEFYHALWSGLSPEGLVDTQIPEISLLDSNLNPGSKGHDIFTRFVTSSSKGLAEVTESNPPKIQFIHESVRDFLTKDNGLRELWPDLQVRVACSSQGHEKLKECCDHYINHVLANSSFRKLLEESEIRLTTETHLALEISKQFPFLEYAKSCILHHADAAARLLPQEEFLSSFPLRDWIKVNNLFEKFKIRKYTPGANLLYILADGGFSELIRARVKEDSDINIIQAGDRYQYPLFAALANGHKDAVAALLNLSSHIVDGVDVTEGLNLRRDFKAHRGRSPLSWAAQYGRVGLVKMLLRTRIDVDQTDTTGLTALSRASTNGHLSVVELLIDKGASIESRDKDGHSALHDVCWSGHENIARLLIDKGARINIGDIDGHTELHQACMRGHNAVVSFLLDKGADIETADKDGQTPFHIACLDGHEQTARLLIDRGADFKIVSKSGQTPLHQASMKGHKAIASLLLEKGASIDAKNKDGQTPLYQAAMKGHKPTVQLLIDHGADIKICSKGGWTPLQQASKNGHRAIVKLLIDVDIRLGPKKGK